MRADPLLPQTPEDRVWPHPAPPPVGAQVPMPKGDTPVGSSPEMPLAEPPGLGQHPGMHGEAAVTFLGSLGDMHVLGEPGLVLTRRKQVLVSQPTGQREAAVRNGLARGKSRTRQGSSACLESVESGDNAQSCSVCGDLSLARSLEGCAPTPGPAPDTGRDIGWTAGGQRASRSSPTTEAWAEEAGTAAAQLTLEPASANTRPVAAWCPCHRAALPARRKGAHCGCLES